jgi:hypothetical protein
MKKTITYSIFSFFTLVSCKKEYTCDCVIVSKQVLSENGVTETLSNATTLSTRKFTSKKKEAKATCEVNNGTVESSNKMGSANVTEVVATSCALK